MTDAPDTPRRPRPWLALEVALLVVLAVAWIAWPAAGAPARVAWRAGASHSPVEPFATLPSEMPLDLELELDRPMFVYVASHDTVRGTIAMFPSTMLRSDLPANPLPAGRHRLPGVNEGTALQWHSGDGVGATTFMVIASERALPDLAATLTRCRQMGNAAFPKRPLLGTYAPAGGMDTVPPRHQVPDPVLRACHTMLDPLHDGPMLTLEGFDGVYAKALRIRTSPSGPGGTEDENREKLRDALGPLDGMLQATPPKSGR